MQPKQPGVLTVGLFGTCGDSQWRAPFIELFESKNVTYFNPLIPDWTPACAAFEAEHLAADEIILFPVTNESTGFGSLAEIGFACHLAATKNRKVIVYIAPTVSDAVAELVGAKPAKESRNTRALVSAHLVEAANEYPTNIYVVNSMEEMLLLCQNITIIAD